MATTLTREASWNKVGTSIREANSVKEALQIAGLDYEVVKAPIYLSNGSRIKDQFATKIKGSDKVFGIVGKDYTIVQNEEAFSFVDGIISEAVAKQQYSEALRQSAAPRLRERAADFCLRGCGKGTHGKPFFLYQILISGSSRMPLFS